MTHRQAAIHLLCSVLLTTPPRCSWTKFWSDNLIQTLPCSVPGSYRTSSLCGPNDPSTNQLSSSCCLLYRSLQRWSQRAVLSCVSSQQKHSGENAGYVACLQTPWPSLKKIFIVLSTPVHGEPCGRRVSHKLAPLQGGEISDDLPNQQGTPPPLGLPCLPIIRAESLPVR